MSGCRAIKAIRWWALFVAIAGITAATLGRPAPLSTLTTSAARTAPAAAIAPVGPSTTDGAADHSTSTTRIPGDSGTTTSSSEPASAVAPTPNARDSASATTTTLAKPIVIDPGTGPVGGVPHQGPPGSTPLPPLPAGPALSGVVTDEHGVPVAGTSVSLFGSEALQAVTDLAGHYSFATRPDANPFGSWVASVNGNELPAWESSGVELHTFPVVVNFTAYRTAALKGRIIDENGQPYAGVCVATGNWGVTGVDGTFGPINYLQPATYDPYPTLGCYGTPLFDMDGHIPQITLERGIVTEVTWQLRPGVCDDQGTCTAQR